jgi:hypothetical protein
MQAKTLIATAREDYLEDTNPASYLWSDASLLRKCSEAERQACNRANLLYDDTTRQYTQILLRNGISTYALDSKLTVIENIFFDGNFVIKRSKYALDAENPDWRTDSGMTGKTVYAVVQGRSIRFAPMPDLADAGKYVSLEVFRLPDSEITSTSQEFEIPEENHRDLIYWVLHECYKKQDEDTFNQEKSDYYLARFDQIFGPPVSARVRQHQFESPTVLQLTPKPQSSELFATDTDW